MAFDFKKEYKEFYMPKDKPSILEVPPMQYLAIRGAGDPNQPEGDYQKAIEMLYTVAYTLKMSYKTDHQIEGFFEYVVPPLEGFWYQEGVSGFDLERKDQFRWISVIRLPDFIQKADLDWAVETAEKKKKLDCSRVELLCVEEGLCVQILHKGPFDTETASVLKMEQYAEAQGCCIDLSDRRLHHEIYLSDARRVPPENWKTVIRHPIRRR